MLAYQRELFNNDAEQVDNRGALAPPILVKREDIKPQGGKDLDLIGFKCACGSVWCPDCYSKKGLSKRFSNRLQDMDWKRTRQVVLTVDARRFPGMSPQEIFEFLQHDRKAVSSFIRDLQRTHGVEITDWSWNMEWHTNGLPHWHLFVERPDKGKASMIGQDKLHAAWKYAVYVRETKIDNKVHWGKLTEYFGQKGYFKGETKKKNHQLELPAWAKRVTYNIRKTDSMRRKKKADQEPKNQEPKNQEPKNQEPVDQKEPKKTYGEILAACGKHTMIRVRERGKVQSHWEGKVQPCWLELFIPYADFRQMPGEYVEGVGYVVHRTYEEFQVLLMTERSRMIGGTKLKVPKNDGFVAAYSSETRDFSGKEHNFDADFLFGEMEKYDQEKAAQRVEAGLC